MITLFIIVITAIVSVLSFNRRELFYRLQFNAFQVAHHKQYYRLLSHGLVHGDWGHLIVNMFVLYFFGRHTEAILNALASQGIVKFPNITFLVLYLAGMIFASSITLVKHKDNHWYNAVGASGAVAAIMMFCVFFEPWEPLYLYGVIKIPGIIFAVLYIVYSQYMSRKGGDNINHDAHLMGAVFGFLYPLFIDIQLIKYFIAQLLTVFQ